MGSARGYSFSIDGVNGHMDFNNDPYLFSRLYVSRQIYSAIYELFIFIYFFYVDVGDFQQPYTAIFWMGRSGLSFLSVDRFLV